MKDHERAQLVNELRDIAQKYHGHDCLRELISKKVNQYLNRWAETKKKTQ